MNESYEEWIVARKGKGTDVWIKGAAYGITAVLFFLGLSRTPLFILAIAAAVACYFYLPNLELEYEYLYMNKELQIDKIMSKKKRQKVAEFSLDKMELLAKEESIQLESYKGRNLRKKDFSSGNKEAKRYVMIVGGEQMLWVYLEPSDSMLSSMKSAFPRQVFL